MKFHEFEQHIASYKKQQDFTQLLQFFKENKAQFTSEQITSNAYLISNVLMALRKTKNFKSVNTFLRSIRKHFL